MILLVVDIVGLFVLLDLFSGQESVVFCSYERTKIFDSLQQLRTRTCTELGVGAGR
jgi:hypothetical protein